MRFDIQLAIAKLDLASCTDRPDLDGLRARYPELGFVFDRLADLQEVEASVDQKIHQAVDYAVSPLTSHINALEERGIELRQALRQIRELTVDAEITTIIEDAL